MMKFTLLMKPTILMVMIAVRRKNFFLERGNTSFLTIQNAITPSMRNTVISIVCPENSLVLNGRLYDAELTIIDITAIIIEQIPMISGVPESPSRYITKIKANRISTVPVSG